MIGYLKRRLGERLTWAAFGAAIPAAAMLSAPWSYLSIGIAIVVALLPSPAKAGGDA